MNAVKAKPRSWKPRSWKPRSWKPRRRGPIFCSPACGSGCLHADYEKAWKDATNLIERLSGGAKESGWEPRIWENGDWYWEVSNGIVTISGPHAYHDDWRGSLRGEYGVSAPTLTRLLELLEKNVEEHATKRRKDADDAFTALTKVMKAKQGLRRKV